MCGSVSPTVETVVGYNAIRNVMVVFINRERIDLSMMLFVVDLIDYSPLKGICTFVVFFRNRDHHQPRYDVASIDLCRHPSAEFLGL